MSISLGSSFTGVVGVAILYLEKESVRHLGLINTKVSHWKISVTDLFLEITFLSKCPSS